MCEVTSFQLVSEGELREIFNREFASAIMLGQFEEEVTREFAPRKLPSRAIRGTMTQIVHYHWRGGCIAAVVHRYMRPDGRLAASGLEDPKQVMWNHVCYQLTPRPSGRKRRHWRRRH
ncbi:MAG TPA: hypothetical protein VNH82_00275 [Candidatus Dormibacteraeota bacterium]|nr:hypothetical protein [Candidatus Dormibacteraeota bacterium]